MQGKHIAQTETPKCQAPTQRFPRQPQPADASHRGSPSPTSKPPRSHDRERNMETDQSYAVSGDVSKPFHSGSLRMHSYEQKRQLQTFRYFTQRHSIAKVTWAPFSLKSELFGRCPAEWKVFCSFDTLKHLPHSTGGMCLVGWVDGWGRVSRSVSDFAVAAAARLFQVGLKLTI